MRRCDARSRAWLTPGERVGSALEAYRGVAELLDDTLEIEELTLALDCAFVDAALLRGHVGQDRLGVARSEVERAERRGVTEQRADLRFFEQRLRAHLHVAQLAADVQREREDDEYADEARVGDGERAEVENDAPIESLLPEQQERPRDEIGSRAKELGVGGSGDRKAEPGHGDRCEHEHVADDLEDRPEP